MCIWHPEADSLIFDNNALEIVYHNNRVDSFIQSTNKLGIAGIKGQGKTFLIKAKRHELERTKSALFLPIDAVMIDSLSTDVEIRSRQRKFLSSYTNWVSIWKIAIAITILQHPDVCSSNLDMTTISVSKSTHELLEIRNDNHRPSVVIYQMLGMTVKELNNIIYDLPKLLQCLSFIDRAIFVFIDKIDQAFSHHAYEILGDTNSVVGYRNASIWQYSQLSLANAAYDIYVSSNNHIKVFYTIRQEALLDAENVAPNMYRNFSAFITKLEYSKEDLFGMFSLYICNEKNTNLREPGFKAKNPEKAFVGIQQLSHGYVNDTESFFSYIYRHTMGRASDIQLICYNLFMHNVKSLDIDMIRHIVNDTARELLKEYLAEIEPFTFKCSKTVPTLLSGMNTNVFNGRYMRVACRRYMLSSGITDSCKMQCENCSEFYPFAELYNIGLLGYLHSSQSNTEQLEQRFASPTQRVLLGESASIPTSDIYFLHPIIGDWARELRMKHRRYFENTHQVIVGNTYKCSRAILQKIEEEQDNRVEMLKEENVFISSTMKNLYNVRRIVAKALLKKGYYPVYYESPEYQIDTVSFTHDACIDSILDCACFVTIFGDKYGGEYSGEKYIDISMEICEKSGMRIVHPSITLMEYYSARKQGKYYLVFMDKSIEIYHDSEAYTKRKQLEWSQKSDMDKMALTLDFINHVNVNEYGKVPQGNSIVFYDKEEQIEEYISNHMFIQKKPPKA